MSEYDPRNVHATGVLCYTLVGVRGTPPLEHGNCFSVEADDGRAYRIINFVYENLEALIAAGLTYPIDIRVLDNGVAVINDRRIPHAWYTTKFCEVCCPRRLLPMPQTLRIEREIAQGIRVEHANGMVSTYSGVPECLIQPTINFKWFIPPSPTPLGQEWWQLVRAGCCQEATELAKKYQGLRFYPRDDKKYGWFIDHDITAMAVRYCPWCGSKLPTADELKDGLARLRE